MTTTPAPPEIPVVAATMDDALVEIEKLVRDSARRYPDLVARGRLKLETAAHKLAAQRKAQTLLTWFATNGDWIRAEAERRRTAARQRAEVGAEPVALCAECEAKAKEEAVRRHPAVADALDTFPGATIAAIREIEPETQEHVEA